MSEPETRYVDRQSSIVNGVPKRDGWRLGGPNPQSAVWHGLPARGEIMARMAMPQSPGGRRRSVSATSCHCRAAHFVGRSKSNCCRKSHGGMAILAMSELK
jgi:hypothetical protein